MSFRKNVVEFLYVVHARMNGTKYQFRVKAESEENAKSKAQRDMSVRFNHAGSMEIVGVEKIEPDDFI